MEWCQAHRDKRHKEDDGEVLHVTILKLRGELDHGNLPCQAKEPNEDKDQCHPVKLVMDQLVVLVNLEDEGVVDVEASEDLYGEAC